MSPLLRQVPRVLDTPEDAFKIISAKEYMEDSPNNTAKTQDIDDLGGPVMSTASGGDFDGYSGLSTYVHDIEDFFK